MLANLTDVSSAFLLSVPRTKAGSLAMFSTNQPSEETNENHLMAAPIIPEQAANIRVIYESDAVLAIDKPPTIAHHNSEDEMGIVSCVRHLQQEKKIHYQGRLYSVHRLDRVTSGILLFAKSSEIANELSEAFRNKSVTKYYVALTNKKPKKKQGWVKGDMAQSRRKAWKLTNTSKNPAMTRFFTAGLGKCRLGGTDDWADLDGFDSEQEDGVDAKNLLPKTMILFRPHTGKTHQLRVAAKSLSMPILGDETYSDAKEAKTMKRTFLHALALHVNVKGEDITICNFPSSWFESDADSEDVDADEGNGMKEVLESLLVKHCDNAAISHMI